MHKLNQMELEPGLGAFHAIRPGIGSASGQASSGQIASLTSHSHERRETFTDLLVTDTVESRMSVSIC